MTKLANKDVDKASAAEIKAGVGTDKIMTVDNFKQAASVSGLDYPIIADGNVYVGNGGGNIGGNTAIGTSMPANTTGIHNAANGYAALYSNTTGNNNTANGYAALYSNTTGSQNTANGVYAGSSGNYTNATHIGYFAQASADNEIRLGNSSVTAVRSVATFYGAAFVPTSDKRLKINISPIDKDKAAELSKLVDFVEYDRIQGVVELESEYKRMVSMHESRRDNVKSKDKSKDKNNASAEDLSDDLAAIEAELEETHKTYKSKIAAATKEVLRHEAGVIAQELQKVTKKIGAFEWLVKLSDPNDENSILTVDYQSLNSILHIGYRHRLEKAGI